jgi:LmbE family N-acetylglucosaminyl deacetylase
MDLTRKEFLLTLAAAPALAQSPVKILLVFAHPDDESIVAATTYRITRELGGIADHIVLTNGEGGYKYSKLAESLYHAALSEEATGRSRLPEIRRQETLQAGRILGIRRHAFLQQRDARFTLDSREALDELWDTATVARALDEQLRGERYTAIFTLRPDPTTHGHHQAAALLAREAVLRLPAQDRPVLLGAEPSPEHPAAHPDYVVSRLQPFGYQNALDYSIVVNWVIAEHKSQGLLQRDCNRYDREEFHVLEPGSTANSLRIRQLFAQLHAGR